MTQLKCSGEDSVRLEALSKRCPWWVLTNVKKCPEAEAPLLRYLETLHSSSRCKSRLVSYCCRCLCLHIIDRQQISSSILITMNGYSTMTQKRWPIWVLVMLRFLTLPTYTDKVPENETEVSFFNKLLYEQFKLNPEVSFDCIHNLSLIDSRSRLVGIPETWLEKCSPFINCKRHQCSNRSQQTLVLNVHCITGWHIGREARLPYTLHPWDRLASRGLLSVRLSPQDRPPP